MQALASRLESRGFALQSDHDMPWLLYGKKMGRSEQAEIIALWDIAPDNPIETMDRFTYIQQHIRAELFHERGKNSKGGGFPILDSFAQAVRSLAPIGKGGRRRSYQLATILAQTPEADWLGSIISGSSMVHARRAILASLYDADTDSCLLPTGSDKHLQKARTWLQSQVLGEKT